MTPWEAPRSNGIQEVSGSIPLISTKNATERPWKHPRFQGFSIFLTE